MADARGPAAARRPGSALSSECSSCLRQSGSRKTCGQKGEASADVVLYHWTPAVRRPGRLAGASRVSTYRYTLCSTTWRLADGLGGISRRAMDGDVVRELLLYSSLVVLEVSPARDGERYGRVGPA